MAASLEGSLGDTSLLSLLRLLHTDGRTGRLELKRGTDKSTIFFRAGNIDHAVAGELQGTVGLNELLTWLEGEFSFVPDVNSPKVTIEAPTEELLAEAEASAAEWTKIKEVIPHGGVVFRLAARKEGGPQAVAFEPGQWEIIAHVNGAHTVAEIAAAAEISEFNAAKVLYGLYAKNIIEVTEAPAKAPPAAVATVGGSFFDRIEQEFAVILGPMASVIVDENIEKLGQTRDAFDRSWIAELVEAISLEIPDEDQRLRFQRIMLAALEEY
ncbi:MAG: DUF4388 domain-containing protein [Candidatus Coatesbacteria bacterium]|nr:MAG: DUF4388 domain-containing protein [Candidatus Coatesbacteria bacterium]